MMVDSWRGKPTCMVLSWMIGNCGGAEVLSGTRTVGMYLNIILG